MSTGNEAEVIAALDAGADLNRVSPLNKNALDYACEYGSADLVECFLQRGARPQSAPDRSTYPFRCFLARADSSSNTIRELWLASRESGVPAETLLDILAKHTAGQHLIQSDFPGTRVINGWLAPRVAQAVIMKMDSREPTARPASRRL